MSDFGGITRFSTPDPDLDDHRHQQETLPRADTTQQRSRRGTLESIQTDLPIISPRVPVAQYLPEGMIARDFEHAVADDNSSTRSGRSNHSRRSLRTPIVARRATFRRPTIDQHNNARNSISSRSSSPPNSVDAFGNHSRLRRLGTNEDNNHSVTNLSIVRTASITSQGKRHLAPSESKNTEGREPKDDQSIRSSIEDDVCFPGEESNKTYTIDFEELDEFAAEQHDKTPTTHPYAITPTPTNKIFHDLRGEKCNADSANCSDVMDEKVAVDSPDGEKEERSASYDQVTSKFAFFSSEADDVVHATDLAGLTKPGEGFRELFELGPEGGVWWLDMTNPSEEEVTVICKAFGVHPLTREDIATQETREKVELFRSYYFVCFRSFYQEKKIAPLDDKSKGNVDDRLKGSYVDDSELEPVNVYAVVFREGLLTFSFCPNQHASNVRKRIGRLRDYVNLSADWICYAMIDEIVDAFAPMISKIEDESDVIEDQVFISRLEDAHNILRRIGECRKRVMSMLRLIGGKADVIKGFAKRCNEEYSVTPRGDVGMYLSDVQDHVVTMMSNLAHFEKMLSRSHSNYLAQLSLDSMSEGSRANQMLGKITLLATILVPLNLIAGILE